MESKQIRNLLTLLKAHATPLSSCELVSLLKQARKNLMKNLCDSLLERRKRSIKTRREILEMNLISWDCIIRRFEISSWRRRIRFTSQHQAALHSINRAPARGDEYLLSPPSPHDRQIVGGFHTSSIGATNQSSQAQHSAELIARINQLIPAASRNDRALSLVMAYFYRLQALFRHRKPQRFAD